MTDESRNVVYTHGYQNPALANLDGRTAGYHAYWLLPHLKSGMRVLDAGPGPGTITLGIADAVAPGLTTGVEIGQEYVDRARGYAESAGISNVEFVQGDATSLDYEDSIFDIVFSFAVLEHLADPLAALREWSRVLKPGGLIAVGSSDVTTHAYPKNSPLGGESLHFYLQLWERNGGHPEMARDQPRLVREAGFEDIEVGGFFDHNDVSAQARTWPERIRDPELIKTVSESGWATADEVIGTANAIEAIGDDPDQWYLRSWFWALGRKPS